MVCLDKVLLLWVVKKMWCGNWMVWVYVFWLVFYGFMIMIGEDECC